MEDLEDPQQARRHITTSLKPRAPLQRWTWPQRSYSLSTRSPFHQGYYSTLPSYADGGEPLQFLVKCIQSIHNCHRWDDCKEYNGRRTDLQRQSNDNDNRSVPWPVMVWT